MTGAELKALREARGLSLSGVAKLCCVSRRTIMRWQHLDVVPDWGSKLFEHESVALATTRPQLTEARAQP